MRCQAGHEWTTEGRRLFSGNWCGKAATAAANGQADGLARVQVPIYAIELEALSISSSLLISSQLRQLR